MSIPHFKEKVWMLVPEENPDPRLQIQATLLRWLRTKHREGYALVRFTPGLGPENWGLNGLANRGYRLPLTEGILVPRHAGFSLLEGGPYPLSAHITNIPNDITFDGVIKDGSLESLFWVMVSPFDEAVAPRV